MSKKMLFIIVGLVIFIVVILSVIYFSNNNENISNVDFKDNTTNEVALTNTIDNTNTMEIEKQENQVLNVIQEETQESKENTEDKISKETNDNQNVNTKDITSKSNSNNQNTKETNQNNKGSSTSQSTTTETNNNPVPTPTPPVASTSKPETTIEKITQEELTDEIKKYKADIMAIKPGFNYVYAKRGQTFYPYRTSEIEIGVGNVTFGTIYYYVEIFVEGNQEKFRYYIDWEGN